MPSQPIVAWTVQVEGDSGDPVTLPLHLAAHLPTDDAATVLRAEVTVEPALRGGPVDLAIPYLLQPATLTVDGEPARRAYVPQFDGYRGHGLHRWHIPSEAADDGRLELTLRIHRTWDQNGWVETVPRILPSDAADWPTFLSRVSTDLGFVFATAMITLIGLTYLAVYLVDGSRVGYLWFAIQGLGAAYYAAWNTGATQALGVWDVSLIGIFLPSAIAASVRFTHIHLGLGRPPLFFSGLWALTVALALAVGGRPFEIQWVTRATVVMLVLTAAYQLWITFREGRRGNQAGWMLMFGWVILAATSSTDMLAWAGVPVLGLRLAWAGIIVFATVQSLTLSLDHTRSMRWSDRLNAELEQRVVQLEQRQGEVQHLNEELRRQISDRSRQLYAALALLGHEGGVSRPLEPGDVVQERYEVVRVVGRGGMGTVYEVVRLSDRRPLALKVTTALRGSALARLAREAEIAAQVHHPNVVSIVDVDVASSGFLYLVMELVPGASLQEQSARYGHLAWGLGVVQQVGDGLAALHAAGVIHRDLKPANVLLAGDVDHPEVKITDFGISQVAEEATGSDGVETRGHDRPSGAATETGVMDEEHTSSRASDTLASVLPPQMRDSPEDTHDLPTAALAAGGGTMDRGMRAFEERVASPVTLTRTGHVAGTPPYMAPELADGKRAAGPASDVFALGVMTYEVLSGHRPFERAPIFLRLEGLSIPPPPALADRVGVPAELGAVVDACLDLDPESRPTLDEVLQAVEAARRVAGQAHQAV